MSFIAPTPTEAMSQSASIGLVLSSATTIVALRESGQHHRIAEIRRRFGAGQEG
jgi:hypothetical protein